MPAPENGCKRHLYPRERQKGRKAERQKGRKEERKKERPKERKEGRKVPASSLNTMPSNGCPSSSNRAGRTPAQLNPESCSHFAACTKSTSVYLHALLPLGAPAADNLVRLVRGATGSAEPSSVSARDRNAATGGASTPGPAATAGQSTTAPPANASLLHASLSSLSTPHTDARSSSASSHHSSCAPPTFRQHGECSLVIGPTSVSRA